MCPVGYGLNQGQGQGHTSVFFVICASFITVPKIQYYCHYNAVANQKFLMEGFRDEVPKDRESRHQRCREGRVLGGMSVPIGVGSAL